MMWMLARRELVSLPGGGRLAVHCASGVLWVTQHGDPKDVVLEAGESVALDREGTALVQALCGPAVLRTYGSSASRMRAVIVEARLAR